MDTKILEELLNFGSEWKVEKINFDKTSNEINIYLKFNLHAYKSVHKGYNGLHDYRDFRRWRHLNIFQYKTYINARIPRIKDKQGHIRSVQVPWADTM